MIGRFYLDNTSVFAPYDADAKNAVDKLVVDRLYSLDVLWPRDLHLQGMVFAKIGAIAKLLGVKPDALRGQLLVGTGRFKLLTTFDRMPVIAVQSMSPRDMSDEELTEFWAAAAQLIEARVVPTIDDEATRAAVRGQL